jgi:hypothetical protein
LRRSKTEKEIEIIEKTMLKYGIYDHQKADEYLEWMSYAKKPTQKEELKKLKELSERQDQVIAQATDEITDLTARKTEQSRFISNL